MEITLNLCYCGALFIHFALVPTPTCLTHVALLLLYLFCPSWLIINIEVSPKTNVSGQIVYLFIYWNIHLHLLLSPPLQMTLLLNSFLDIVTVFVNLLTCTLLLLLQLMFFLSQLIVMSFFIRNSNT
jgi:hypothetical protein